MKSNKLLFVLGMLAAGLLVFSIIMLSKSLLYSQFSGEETPLPVVEVQVIPTPAPTLVPFDPTDLEVSDRKQNGRLDVLEGQVSSEFPEERLRNVERGHASLKDTFLLHRSDHDQLPHAALQVADILKLWYDPRWATDFEGTESEYLTLSSGLGDQHLNNLNIGMVLGEIHPGEVGGYLMYLFFKSVQGE